MTAQGTLTPLGRVHLLTNYLIQERGGNEFLKPEDEFEESFEMFRALVNLREPKPIPQGFLDEQDIMLQSLLRMEGVTHVADIPAVEGHPKLRLWGGDVTVLEVDGVVNPANSRLLGCFQPGHYCIDNAIHTFAGVQLRMECADIMQQQGKEEQPGKAKVTGAYNLPSKHVIHTVAPVAEGSPTPEQRKQLTDCYINCLNAAAYHDMRSVAFTPLGTGFSGFPQKEAARIASDAVEAWLTAHADADLVVVFALPSEEDYRIYQQLLGITD